MDPTYDENMRKLRKTEFSHSVGITYLDHAGATLYAKSQLEAHYSDLTANLYGNPHSQNPSSRLATDTVDYVRGLVLRHFNTNSSEYDLVFTSGCTGALRLLSESFPWSGRNFEPRATNQGGSGSFPGSGGKSSRQATNQLASTSADHQVVDTREEIVYTHNFETVSNGGNERQVYSCLRSQQLADDCRDCSSDNFRTLDDSSSVFCYLEDNHTSVIGMREVATQYGTRTVCTTEHEVLLTDERVYSSENCHIDQTHTRWGKSEATEETQHLSTNGSPNEIQAHSADLSTSCHTEAPPTSHSHSPTPHEEPEVYHLFAYPAQSNFSGRKYPLSWIEDLPVGRVHITSAGSELGRRGSWKVLLDAAAFVSTNPLDLSRHPAHFVTISFYKMFGFPTGLGALLVRRDCAPLLRKSYYGGGTVVATISRERFHIPRAELHDRFEDGTLPFLGIVALRHGFDALQRLGRSMESISRHTFSLARYVHHCLSQMSHGNGRPVSVLYSDTDFEDHQTQGAIVNFNLLRADGQFVGYSEVDKLASVQDIHLRTGCFCNTGACMRFLGLSSERVKSNMEAGHACGDDVDLVDSYPTGSVRISFGYMSTLEDAQKFVRFIEQCFVNPETPAELETSKNPAATVSQPPSPPTVPSLEESLGSARVSPGNLEPATQDITGVSASQRRGSRRESEAVTTAEVASLSGVEGTGLKSRQSCSCAICGRQLSTPTCTSVNCCTCCTCAGTCGGCQVVSPGSDGVAFNRCDITMREPSLFADPASGYLEVGDIIEAWSGGQQGSHRCSTVRLEKISLYPVKSCAGVQVTKWPLGGKGLLFDREWMVLNELGSCLSQKQEPRLCLIQPSVDLATRKMTLKAEGWHSLEVPLETVGLEEREVPGVGCRGQALSHPTRICGDRVQWLDCGDVAAQWMSHVLSRKCRLVRQSPSSQRKAQKHPAGDESISLSLANEGQYLLVSSSSVADLHRAMTRETTDQPLSEREGVEESRNGVEHLMERFRSNLVVGGDNLKPYVEDEWQELRLRDRDIRLDVTGQCSRCQVIAVDQRSATRSPKPLQVLFALRGNKSGQTGNEASEWSLGMRI